MNFPIIDICGNTSTGTTTLTKTLCDTYGWKPIYSEDYFKNSPFFDLFFSEPHKWAFYNQTFFLIEYIESYRNAIKLNVDSLLCFDYSVYELLIYSKAMKNIGYLNLSEYQIVYRIFENLILYLKAPDLIIYIKADFSTIRDRIQKRNRHTEKQMSDEYLASLQEEFETFIKEWDRSPIITLCSDTQNFYDKNTIELIERNIKSFLFYT